MDMGLSKLRDMVKDREAWHAAIHGVTKSQTRPKLFIEWICFLTCLWACPLVVSSLSCVRLFAILGTSALQDSLFITNSRSLSKLLSIEAVMPSNHLILCHPLLRLPSIFPSVRVFSNDLALRIRWPKYWSFSFSISPSNEYSGLTSFRIDWFYLFAAQGLSRVFFNTTVRKHKFFSAQASLWSSSHIHTWLLGQL